MCYYLIDINISIVKCKILEDYGFLYLFDDNIN